MPRVLFAVFRIPPKNPAGIDERGGAVRHATFGALYPASSCCHIHITTTPTFIIFFDGLTRPRQT
jgi:hypothetical protein